MQPLLLLHGAIGASAQLQPLSARLSSHYIVHTLDFTGHGTEPLTDDPYSIALFAADVLRYMERHHLPQISIFGYSMGGYVGMYLAKHHAGKVNKLITLGMKPHWDEATAAKEIKMVDPEKIMEKLPAFAETLKNRHASTDWKEVLARSAAMMVAMGNDNPLKLPDYADITIPVLMLIGDRDKMTSVEETTAVYRALPNAQMGMLPATPHPIEQVDTELLVTFINRFLQGEV